MCLYLKWRQNLTFTSLLAAVICLPACSDQPSDAQIEAWRQAAITRNAQIAAAYAKNSLHSEWKLVIKGETKTGKLLVLNWQQLETLATAQITTTDPNHVVDPKEKFTFRGVTVATLLQRFGMSSDVEEVTFVSFDGYQVTVSGQDLRKYPIALAIARNNQPIPREQGGPIYLIFPYLQHPELKNKYNDAAWGFYVSNMVIGNQPVSLRVGQRELDLATLDKLPQQTLTQPVRYRMGWPSSTVTLQGVRVRDILTYTGMQIPAQGVVVRGMAPINRDTTNPVRLSKEDVDKCDVILATRWGEDLELIPARMGGPLTLAYSYQCPVNSSQQRWITFVEELKTAP